MMPVPEFCRKVKFGKFDVYHQLLPAAGLIGILLALAVAVLVGQDRPPQELTLNVLSFNIRYANPHDGPNAWTNRKSMAAAVFRERQVDIAGLQEALIGQVRDLEAALPEYAWTGVGRDDGREKGELAAIFYHRASFDFSGHGTFWLSETPEVPGSIHWGNAITRIATFGIFTHKQTGLSMFVINTHLDHMGARSRQKSAALILSRTKALSRGLPVILTGDLNATPDSSPLITLTSDKELKLADSMNLSSTPHFGPATTFNGFGSAVRPERIDFILVSPDFTVNEHGHIQVRSGETYISDHYPVLAKVVLKR